MNPYLQRIPVVVAADVEPNLAIGSPEWATNSVCGNDMNSYVAKYIGRYARFLEGSPLSAKLQRELRILLNAYHTIKCLRHDYLGRFGDAPGGFHSATGDELLYFKVFGTTINTVDLLRVREVYDAMETEGIKEKRRLPPDRRSSIISLRTWKKGRPLSVLLVKLRKKDRRPVAIPMRKWKN